MIQNAPKLLNSLEHNADSSIKPSMPVITFLNRIESADPNSLDILEDETNGNWGHRQFTAGNMQCTTVLTSWDDIGVITACKLVAAAVKTCRVARHICHHRDIPTDSYLSDAYLQTLVNSLWTAMEKDQQVG